jgi:hypothetical protein
MECLAPFSPGAVFRLLKIEKRQLQVDLGAVGQEFINRLLPHLPVFSWAFKRWYGIQSSPHARRHSAASQHPRDSPIAYGGSAQIMEMQPG